MEIKVNKCGLCGKKVDSQSELDNEIGLKNSHWHFFANDVCGACVGAIGKIVEERGGQLVQSPPETENTLKQGN